MDFEARIEPTGDGEYLATCSDPEVSALGLSGASDLPARTLPQVKVVEPQASGLVRAPEALVA